MASIDLGPLDRYLDSGQAPDDGMGLSDLDGVLTGIIAGPEFILPSEWLPVVSLHGSSRYKCLLPGNTGVLASSSDKRMSPCSGFVFVR